MNLSIEEMVVLISLTITIGVTMGVFMVRMFNKIKNKSFDSQWNKLTENSKLDMTFQYRLNIGKFGKSKADQMMKWNMRSARKELTKIEFPVRKEVSK